MKAMIHTEIRCGECSGMMQYHEDNKVKCNQLKCSERGVEYEAPTIELVKIKVKKPRKAKT